MRSGEGLQKIYPQNLKKIKEKKTKRRERRLKTKENHTQSTEKENKKFEWYPPDYLLILATGIQAKSYKHHAPVSS